MSLVTKMTTLVKLLEWTVVIFFPSVAVHGICNAILVCFGVLLQNLPQ